MFGFFFGTACLIGLAAVVARGHRYRRHGYYGRPWGPRSSLYAAFSRLDATPAQEKAILSAVEELKDTVRTARGSFRQTREAAARAVRGERFDDAPLRDAFTTQDAAFSQIREAVGTAGRKIHEVLDERQRKTLADMIESGPGMWLGGGFGPMHRGHCC